jgi:hypothetical protein
LHLQLRAVQVLAPRVERVELVLVALLTLPVGQARLQFQQTTVVLALMLVLV